MPLAPTLLTVGAALIGAILGWWPLTLWADRNVHKPSDKRMPLRTLRVWSSLATAAGFAVLAWRFGAHPVLPALLALVATGVVLSIVDLTEHRLPNAVLLPTLAIVAGLLVLASALTGEWQRLLWALAGGAGMFLFYFVLAMISPAGMGMGDVKFAAPLGLALGWFGWNVWFVGLAGGFIIGGVVSLIALVSRRVTIRESIPFGPSMLAGALVAILAFAG